MAALIVMIAFALCPRGADFGQAFTTTRGALLDGRLQSRCSSVALLTARGAGSIS
jgi:hypothetical protein